MHTLNHGRTRSNDSEVLRVCGIHGSYNGLDLVCSTGSDGLAVLWKLEDRGDSSSPKYRRTSTLSHRSEASQVYACELVASNDSTSCAQQFITAADNELFLWDTSSIPLSAGKWSFQCHSGRDSEGVFGGLGRNPDKEAFIFDAKPCPNLSHQAVVALAMSDGTIRLLDTRQSSSTAVVLSLSSLEEAGSKHATSVITIQSLLILIN